MVQIKKNAMIARELKNELKPFRLGNVSDKLPDSMLKGVIGGRRVISGYCYIFSCLCDNGELKHLSIPTEDYEDCGYAMDAYCDGHGICNTGNCK